MNFGDLQYANWLLSKAIPQGDCLVCHLAPDTGGYAQVPGSENAHRFVWKTLRGDPGELWVLHKCDNRPCINLEHLFLGTNADNVADKMAKGRFSRYADRATTKEQREQMRKLYSEGLNLTQIGIKFLVSRNTVRRCILENLYD